ncbi:chemotaxis protein CheW [Leptolyngbya ohadii]|uniref:chemotaxis protein CheW n=1 Tax=Leptolyngbya ohadii TaxID=1962290 RepID=UPI000B598A16|nr:chemotaxis protein CheW [Leptolyngbya ohadii]
MELAKIALTENRLLKPAGDAYLKFWLTPEIPAVIAMQSIQEALVLPARRLTPMPNMHPVMLGLLNRRTRISWVIDLAQLLGVSLLDVSTQQYTIVLLQVGDIPLGLAVHRVEGSVRLQTEQIQSPLGQISASLVPYLRGCALLQQAERQEVLLVLEAEAIVQSSVLRVA